MLFRTSSGPTAAAPAPRTARAWRAVTWRSLLLLLLAQAVTLFMAMPLASLRVSGLVLVDVCRLAFAGVCIRVFTQSRWVRALLVAGLIGIVGIPALAGHPGGYHALVHQHEWLTWTVALFNATVTVLVGRYVFGPGRVGADRVLGAILIYLNLAALFANFYDLMVLLQPGAISGLSPLTAVDLPDKRAAELTYFSLSTITSTGWGDLMPLHPLARGLANFESVIGQLFPATLVARLIGLHLAQGGRRARPRKPPNPPPP
ncbi:MAG: ion channel [Burkholderiaceae bacterium]